MLIYKEDINRYIAVRLTVCLDPTPAPPLNGQLLCFEYQKIKNQRKNGTSYKRKFGTYKQNWDFFWTKIWDFDR